MAEINNERFLHDNTKSYIESILLFFEMFGTVKEYTRRRELLSSFSEQDFNDLLCSIASIVRYGTPEIGTCADGVYTMAIKGGVPFGKDKEKCLELTWKVVQFFLHDRTLSDQESLIYSAITLSNGILLTHPFIDGNGRTTRLLTYSVVNGLPEQDFLEKVILSSGGICKDGFQQDKWFLDFSDYFALFNKESFSGNQPDIIRVEDAKSDKYNGLYYVGTARAIIEYYENDDRVKTALKNSTILENDKTVIYYNDFMLKTKALFTGEEKIKFEEQCMKIHKMKRFRGFINAMISEPPYNFQDIAKMVERCDLSDPNNEDPIGTGIAQKLLNSYSGREVNIYDKNDLKSSVIQLPLRTLFLLYLSKISHRLNCVEKERAENSYKI